MKKTTQSLLCAFALILVPHLFSATEEIQEQSAEYNLPVYKVEEIVSLPKPIHHPFPRVRKGLKGTAIKLKFTVNEKGRPENVRLTRQKMSNFTDEVENFAVAMRLMVSNWKFRPALDANNQPVAVNVIMPIQVVDKGESSEALVKLVLDQDREDRS